MPIYEYACLDCGREFEELVRGDEKPACPACGRKRLERRLSVSAGHVAGGRSGRLSVARFLPCVALLRPELRAARLKANSPLSPWERVRVRATGERISMLSDTHPDAERVQIELLRHATGAQRVAQLRSHYVAGDRPFASSHCQSQSRFGSA